MKSSSVVVDSNLAIYAVIDSEFSVSATQVWSKLLSSKASIYAPELWNYETTSIIRKYCALEWITDAEAEQALLILDQLQIQFLAANLKLCQAAMQWASRLHQKAAYDGFYLAAAEQLGAEFWTADRKLANNANQVGANWVHWMGEMG
jgi:predicted nucleic acid-binding protein